MKFIFLCLFVGFSSSASANNIKCPAISFEEFFSQYRSGISSADGPNFDFDFINEASCFSGSDFCLSGSFLEDGIPGYYDPHIIYFIQLNGKMIFAKTSEYFDGTYGSTHGSSNAKEEWTKAFEKLRSENRCY